MSRKQSHAKTYTCEHCRGTFSEGWSDADANAEALAQWGVSDASKKASMARICDDCYQAFMQWHREAEAVVKDHLTIKAYNSAVRAHAAVELMATLNPRAAALARQLIAEGMEPFFAALFAREDEAFTRPADPTWQAVED